MNEYDITLGATPSTLDANTYRDEYGSPLTFNLHSTAENTVLTVERSSVPVTLNQFSDGIATTSNIKFDNSETFIGERHRLDSDAPHTYNYDIYDSGTMRSSPEASADMFQEGSTTNIRFSYDESKPRLFFHISGDTDISEATNIPNISSFIYGSSIRIVTPPEAGKITGMFDEESQEIRFFNENGDNIIRFDLGEGHDASHYIFVDGGVYVPCYLKGTHIATPIGESKIETLKIGDKVLRARGGVATVKWLGHRTLYKNRIPTKDAVKAFPILFKKDCIAQNVPHRDLTLSPGHHVFFDGLLVPAMMLVNGQTIIQQFDTEVFEYYHVELEQFDIILAEGVPAESYVDTGNRNTFQNAREVTMNPDFGPSEGRPIIKGVEVVQQGSAVEAIRNQLLMRAEQMTGASRTTEAALCIEINGQVITPTEIYNDNVYRFQLPEAIGDVHIVSRSAIVRETTNKPTRDMRQVGVGITSIVLDSECGRDQIDLNGPTLRGFHEIQDSNGKAMRWTSGRSIVPKKLINASGKAMLELMVLRVYTYWEDIEDQKIVRAA